MKLPSSSLPPSPELGPADKDSSSAETKPPMKRARYDTHNIPDEYEFMMPPEQVKNTYVFSEVERRWTGFVGGSGVVVKAESGSSGGVTFGKRKREKGACIPRSDLNMVIGGRGYGTITLIVSFSSSKVGLGCCA